MVGRKANSRFFTDCYHRPPQSRRRMPAGRAGAV